MQALLRWLKSRFGQPAPRVTQRHGPENDPVLEKKLKARIQDYADRTGRLLAVSLEDFFQGNGDIGSIGSNLVQHPGLAVFAEALYSLRGLPQVQDVLVGITDGNQGDDDIWPFSDWVYILTSLDAETVRQRIQVLEPDDVFYEGTPDTEHPDHGGLPELNPGYRLLIAWWD